MKKQSKNYTYAAGQRRLASARVRLLKGKGDSLVNDKKVAEYFSSMLERSLWEKPFEATKTQGKYHVHVRVMGGGKTGQFQAVLHGIAKSLAKENSEFKTLLRKSGLLTRDSRIRERRKIGTGGKSRRAKQSPKR